MPESSLSHGSEPARVSGSAPENGPAQKLMPEPEPASIEILSPVDVATPVQKPALMIAPVTKSEQAQKPIISDDPHEITAFRFTRLYPSEVTEIRDNERYLIVKTYELGADENPDDILRESFERDDFMFTLRDITRKETANAQLREHTETVTLNSDTNELEKILPLLSQTMEFEADDGFAGVLSLDMSSIIAEAAESKTSSYTKSIIREYPHLSSNDTGFVPKTVTESGRTYTLACVDWRAGNTATADYEALPEYYTAIATYTANITASKVTGYVITAVYNGTLSGLLEGRTIYTAFFEGKEINKSLEISKSAFDPAALKAPTLASPQTQAVPGAAKTSGPSALLTDMPLAGNKTKTPLRGALPAVIVILVLLGGGVYYYMKRKGKTK
jgi:hypothetical protein